VWVAFAQASPKEKEDNKIGKRERESRLCIAASRTVYNDGDSNLELINMKILEGENRTC
jgi:hypothetical protein